MDENRDDAQEGTDEGGRGAGGTGTDPPPPALPPTRSPGLPGELAAAMPEAYSWASRVAAPVVFVALSALLGAVSPVPAGPVWALGLLALLIGSETAGFRLSRGVPSDAMPGRNEVFQEFVSAVFMGSIVYTSFVLFPFAALFLDDGRDIFMAGLIASVPVGAVLGQVRVSLCGATRYSPEEDASPGASIRPAHWLGLVLLLLAAAASWRLIAGTIEGVVGTLDEATAELAAEPVADRIGFLVAVALAVVAAALPAGFLGQWAIPQIHLVQERVTPGLDDWTRKYFLVGLTLGVSLLVDLGIALFL